MGATSIGDAVKHVLESNGWKQRMMEIRIKSEWEKIVGKTIAKYTGELYLYNKVLTIGTTVAPLKQELRFAKDSLIKNINDYFGEIVILDLKIK
ncbi:DUF721 domain-containing protein [Taibaiella sp. KBW10]|uniref:DUF721 domain-containing protein n=1 Tax=Taibaiella sp. KBW10 TaxID=2153357 RepID=UPI000F59D9F6|nr:DUF721 domain-containing protein [Taibaiella sp. KBW10]RQO30750.1 DUF721 domain-containing protein [Taibaiella sp. KBW10]